MEVNIHDAKTNLSRLIEKVQAGEEVIIAKAGRPVARLIRLEPEIPVLGGAKGAIEMKPGWDDPLTDEELDEIFGA
jgi:prevent-host-death family protein